MSWAKTSGPVPSGRQARSSCRYANFMHVQHAAGRGGPGAVFGSKRLKAVAVRGTGGIPIAGPTTEYIKDCKELHDIIMENPVRPAFRWAGTTGMLPVMNEAVGLPYMNHQDDQVPDVSSIHNDEIAKYVKRYEACSGCNVICGSVVEFERRAAPIARSASSTSPRGLLVPTAGSSICRRSWRPTTSATSSGSTR